MTDHAAATEQTIDIVASALIEAARTATPRAPIKDLLPPGDAAAAYRVQARVTERAVADGRRIVGRKIGLTSAAVQKQLGVDQPDFGMLFDDMAYADGETIPLATHAAAQGRGRGRDRPRARPRPRRASMLIDVITRHRLRAAGDRDRRQPDRQLEHQVVDTVADNASSRRLRARQPCRASSTGSTCACCGMVMTRRGEPFRSASAPRASATR